MKKLKPGNGDWIVVCDGRKALILGNIGDEKYPNLRAKERHEHPDRPTHLLGCSPPGRAFQSIGQRRSAVAQADLHEEAERVFLHGLAKRLNDILQSYAATKVTIVAPPRALGMLREAYTPVIRSRLLEEIGKDAVKAPVSRIERMIFHPQEE